MEFIALKHKMLAILVILLVFSGCSSQQLKKFAAEALSGSQISYSKGECSAMKLRCPVERYDEWQTSNGKFGCSCVSE